LIALGVASSDQLRQLERQPDPHDHLDQPGALAGAAVLEPVSATPMSFLTRPRGASKTTDLAGIAVAALLEQLPPGAVRRLEQALLVSPGSA
jgi:hypothetical protein